MLNDVLAAKFPVLNGQINEGWQSHLKRPIHVDDILQPPSAGENGYEEEEVEWLQMTVPYYLYISQISQEQLDEKGITVSRHVKFLRSNSQNGNCEVHAPMPTDGKRS
jgi:hypothetical protein